MPNIDAIDIATLHNMARSQLQLVPTDSGMGQVSRGRMQGQRGGRVATAETFFDFFIDVVPDPDEALARDPDFLRKLYEHPDVMAANEKRAKTVSQFTDRILPNPDYPDQKLAEQVASAIGEIWADIPNRHQLYYEMQQAVLRGGVRDTEWE